MKPAYVSDLGPDQAVTSTFLVWEKELLQTRDGKPYLRLELADRTGSIEARMWDGFEPVASSLGRNDFVKVQGRAELYRNRLQLKIDRLRKVAAGEINRADYFLHTAEDIERLYRSVADCAASMANPWLRRLAESVVLDPAIAPKLKRAPAAKTMHHAYEGGLIEHVASLCGLCRRAASHYTEVDPDLLLTGAILHDIGKIDELEYEGETGYSSEGRLLGHILLGLELVRGKIDAIEGFPPHLARVVEHILASHHGREEFGSPRPPMIREALLFHYLDDLDSKMGAMRASLDSPRGEPEWTERNAALNRQILRLDRYLQATAAEAQAGEEATPSLFDLKPGEKR
ncbi:MAG TPA: HD domain-containing protein [Candidatus Acidoferrales bacterium]|nr:HD domain-containing protein [Candidatus Acidoferrales bacterium]